MSSRSLPSLTSAASKSDKDRPLTEAEFPAVWRQFERMVRAAAARVCPCSAVIDDALQETAIFFLERVREGNVRAAEPVIKALLWSTGWHMAQSERRKTRASRHTSLEDDAARILVANDVSPEIAVDACSIARRLAVLGPRCTTPLRWTVVMLALEGAHHDEIQAITGQQGSASRTALYWGLQDLRAALGIEVAPLSRRSTKRKAA